MGIKDLGLPEAPKFLTGFPNTFCAGLPVIAPKLLGATCAVLSPFADLTAPIENAILLKPLVNIKTPVSF
jgi:hypothetical protein